MKDMLESLGALALASRLKRLSDALMQDGVRIYESLGEGFEPRWFPVFVYLYREGPTTITGLARGLGVSHPGINKIANELINARLAAAYRDRHDKRKRVLALTSTGRDKYRVLEASWRDIRQALQSAVDEEGGDFLGQLSSLERSLGRRSFLERYRDQSELDPPELAIVSFQPDLVPAFASLNRAWIERFFSLEAADLKVLDDPETSIINAGGDVLFAVTPDGDVAGTCALLRLSGDTCELAKMAVDDRFRGRQVGQLLGEALIERAASLGYRKLVLESNRRLVPAIRLYEKLGFTERPFPQPSDYARADIYMERPLVDG